MESEILFAAVLFVAFLITRIIFIVREGGSGGDRRVSYASANPFHAVSIVPGRGCCQQVEAVHRDVFLSDDAPALPLAGCGAATCRCRYIHRTDRRDGSRDRRQPVASLTDSWGLRERRFTVGRRQGDLQAA